MSSRSRSPPLSLRRLSTHSQSSSSKNQENLINAYEAEEERIINVLSRKLEKLREEKIDLENALEAESESHVNRLSRELAALRMSQQQQQQQAQNQNQTQANGNLNGHAAANGVGDGIRRENGLVGVPTATAFRPVDPSVEIMLEALRRENEQLRNRLSDIERDYIRISRLNEIYREELIEHRNRLGQSVDNLIGLSSADPFSQPTHHRPSSSSSSSLSSPSTSVQHYSYPPSHSSSSTATRQLNGVPIPRPPSQNHRQPINLNHHLTSESSTPLSHSPTSTSASLASSVSESPYTLSFLASASPGTLSSAGDPASLASNLTNLTTPPSSASFHNHMHYYNPAHYGGAAGGLGGVGVGGVGGQRNLSYPSVPPPSLSSSFGSPTVSYYMGSSNSGARDLSLSPVEPLSRRNSNARRGSHDWRVAETGSLRSISSAGGSANASRRASVERGARVAEMGSLVPRAGSTSRSRAGSLVGSGHSRGQSQNLGLPATTEAVGEDVVDDADAGVDGGGLDSEVATGEVDL